MNFQAGQTMAEYLVVTIALVSAFYWTANADCPGYDNCISKLKTVLHDKYEGYSHSISAVHQYGDLKASSFESDWGEEPPSGGGGSGAGGGGGGLGEVEGLQRTEQVFSEDGATGYGTLVGGQYVVDADGAVIGTYDGATITLEDDRVIPVRVASIVTDEEGNPSPLLGIVECGNKNVVYGFAYRSGVTGKFYSSLTLSEIDIGSLCHVPSYPVVDTSGNTTSGAIVGSYYYATTLSVDIDESRRVVPSGEVVYFDVVVPDEDEYQDSSPGPGARVVDCAVMATGWDADPDRELLDVYLNLEPTARVGSLDPASGVSCPGSRSVED